jgi:Protein of unknown function (DUF3592)
LKFLPLFAEFWDAVDQAGVLLGAGLLCGLGVFLCANRLYWRLWARRVKGVVVGVRAPRKYLYYPVFRYRLTPTGKWLQATADSGSLPNPDLVTGRKARLLVFKKFPDRVAEADTHVLEVLGALFLALGGTGIGIAMGFWPVTRMTWVTVAVIAIFLLYLVRRTTPRWKEPPFSAMWRGARPANLLESAVHPIEALLEGPVRADRRRKQQITGRIVTPILVLVGLGVLFLGGYMGRTIYLLKSSGDSAPGTVQFSELKKNTHGSSYYPVVEFATREGIRVQFRDGMGSNPPAYREGDPVTVLYFRNQPAQTATIDRGLLNWLVPAILCAMGSLLAGVALWARLGAFSG